MTKKRVWWDFFLITIIIVHNKLKKYSISQQLWWERQKEIKFIYKILNWPDRS